MTNRARIRVNVRLSRAIEELLLSDESEAEMIQSAYTLLVWAAETFDIVALIQKERKVRIPIEPRPAYEALAGAAWNKMRQGGGRKEWKRQKAIQRRRQRLKVVKK